MPENKKPITTFLSEKEFEALEIKAKETDRSKSSLVREAVIEWLRR